MHTRVPSSGITLIETIVWVAVLAMAMIAISTTLVKFYQSTRYAMEQASAVASVQHGVDLMVRTIRETSYGSDGSYPIISLAPNQIAFYANVNRADPYIQKVRFYAQGTALYEGVIEPAGDPPVYSGVEAITPIAQSVQNLTIATSTFTYYDQNGTAITDFSRIADVRFVTLNVYVDINPNNSPTRLVLRSSTALRNLITH